MFYHISQINQPLNTPDFYSLIHKVKTKNLTTLSLLSHSKKITLRRNSKNSLIRFLKLIFTIITNKFQPIEIVMTTKDLKCH
jgi:hypothetical protein